MDLQSGQWDEELCRLFGVPMAALPEIVPTTGDFGGLLCDGRAIAVTASVVDQQAALYGHGCRRPGDAKFTFGTGAFALAVTGNRIHRAPDKGLLPTVAWQLAGEDPVYALDGGVYCAASAVNWAHRLGLFQSFDELAHFEGPSAIERGVVFVPALSGLACPYWDRSAAGLWIGLTLDTPRDDLVRAVLEGVALRAAEVLGAMADHVTPASGLSIDGGMAANAYFCQFLADVLQCEVTVPKSAELTALGTALLAATAVDRGAPVGLETDALVFTPGQRRAEILERFGDAAQRARGWWS